IEERRKHATGSANTIAANPLNRIPSFMKNARREREASAGGVVAVFVDILFLRVLRVVQSGIRLPRILRSASCQPGNYIGNFRIGHWTSGNIAAPVGRAQFRSASDHGRAQSLIADQSEE